MKKTGQILLLTMAVTGWMSVTQATPLSDNECPQAANAAYRIIYENSQHPEQTQVVWCYQGDVAWETPANGVVQWWHREPNQQVSMIRLFGSEQRGIAFESTDLRILGKQVDAGSLTTLAGDGWVIRQKDSQTETVAARFAQWKQWDTVDFADIGDMEADPFIRKMINIGFIEDNHVTAYYADGQPIKSEHGHHH